MEIYKLKGTKVKSTYRLTPFGEKVTGCGKAVLGLMLTATVNALLTAVFRDAVNANTKNTRDFAREATQYTKNEIKYGARD